MKMPSKFCVAVFLLAAFSPLSQTQSASTVLDFEGLADRVLLVGQVPGAAFGNAVVFTSGVSLNEFEFPPHSGINVLSDNSGPMAISFTTPVKSVSGYFTYAATVNMRAFDAGNNPVALATSQFANNEALSGAGGSTPNELLTVAFAAGISRITITGLAAGGSFALDDLTIMPPLVAPTVPTGPGPMNPPLTITSPLTLNSIPLGSTLNATLTASGGTPPYTWAAPAPPAGIAVSADGNVSGKPLQAGLYRFVVTVTDRLGLSQGVFLTVSVFGITTTSLPDAVAFSAYSQTLTVTGGTAPFTFSATGLPGGITISPAGVISGIAGKPGVYKLLVQAVDATGVATPAVLSLTVGQPAPLAVPPAALPAGVSGVTYSQQLTAIGGAPPYSWLLTGGALPAGLRLTPSGSVAGVPLATGKFTLSLQATDSAGTAASGTFSLTIAPSSLTLNAAPTLPGGMTGMEYPVQLLTAAGGTPPYTFSLASGTLPAGLTLAPDGVIGGIPSAAGTSTFSAGVTDSAGTTAQVSLSATIRPLSTSPLLSAGSLVFAGVAGSTQLPPAQTVQVQSPTSGTTVSTALSWSAAVSPAVPWLSVLPGSGSTPGSFAVALNSQASALTASSTPYQAAVVVACTAPSSCIGNSQTLNVFLTVNSALPRLSVSNGLLSFVASAQAPQPVSRQVTLQNSGGGSLGIGSVVSGATWLRLGPAAGSLSSGQQTVLTVTADPAGLSAGFYRTTLMLTSSAGTTVVPATLFVASSPVMTLSALGTQILTSKGILGAAPAQSPASFTVGIPVDSPAGWTATVLPGATWLTTSTPSGTASNSAPGTVNLTIDPAITGQLAVGVYYGSVRVASAQVSDSPLDFQVVLNVAPASVSSTPALSPEGLVFVTTAADVPPAQTVQVSAASYQVSASTADGRAWLSASPAPGASQVSVTPTGLASGVYYGAVSYAGTGSGIRTANVTLVVVPPAAAACMPSQVAAARLTPVNNFAASVSRPVPLAVQLFNDCGTPLANGVVTAAFSNGDEPVTLTLANRSTGLYSGTWYPRQPASQVTVNLAAAAPGLAAAAVASTGFVRPSNAPALSPLSTLHIFAPQPAAAVAPGTIVQIYGSGLSAGTATAATLPLGTSLAGTSVSIGGLPAPLFYASAVQINAQVPFELAAEGDYQIVVNNSGALSPPDVLHVSAAAPGLAALANGIAVAQHANGSLVTDLLPAKAGEALVFYASGLGVTNPAVVSGAASPAGTLAVPQLTPLLLIGQAAATIQFVGLTPGLVGLYQINALVPASAPNGTLPVTLSQAGSVSATVNLPVRN